MRYACLFPGVFAPGDKEVSYSIRVEFPASLSGVGYQVDVAEHDVEEHDVEEHRECPAWGDVILMVSDCCRQPYEFSKAWRRTGWETAATQIPLAPLKWMGCGRNRDPIRILSAPITPNKPVRDPVSPPAQDPPEKPMHDPPADPTYEPPRPTTDPTPHPAGDPPPERPSAVL
jgi:hypothetical protein